VSRRHGRRILASIERFLDAVSGADWSGPESATATVVSRMKDYEPSDELQFLMELSIEAVAARQGLLSPRPKGNAPTPRKSGPAA
jgi:hypothetical protein